MRNRYAQIGQGGVVEAVTETAADIDDPRCVRVDVGVDVIGMIWDGEGFRAAPVSRKQQVLAELDAIDRKSGMSRLLRESLLVATGDKAPAMLKTYETNAAALRAEMAGIK